MPHTRADIAEFHRRMGRVNHQPINVTSFTNKRLTVNYRAPLDRLRRLLPPVIEPEEIRSSGQGMLSMCACDFWVTKLGPVPIPRVRNNEMLLRVSVLVSKGGQTHRAYYTLRSDASSRFLGFLGGRFSHFRKAVSRFERIDDGHVYELRCRARDPLCGGWLRARIASLSQEKPPSTAFGDVAEAAEFVLGLDGSCGYSFEKGKLSFQRIDYPDWDIRFCQEVEFDFRLLDEIFRAYDLNAEYDCTLFMENVRQVWRSSWLYHQERAARTPAPVAQQPSVAK